METLTLKDGTVLIIQDGSSPNRFEMDFADLADFNTTYPKLTEENLSEVAFATEGGATCAILKDKKVKQVTIKQIEEGFNVTFDLETVDTTAKRLAELERIVAEMQSK